MPHHSAATPLSVAMARQGFTQRALARALGYNSNGPVYGVLKGKHAIPQADIPRWADVLGLAGQEREAFIDWALQAAVPAWLYDQLQRQRPERHHHEHGLPRHAQAPASVTNAVTPPPTAAPDTNAGLSIWIKRSGISQRELARRLGYTSNGPVQQVAAGRRYVPPDDIPRWADALELTAPDREAFLMWAIRDALPAWIVDLLDRQRTEREQRRQDTQRQEAIIRALLARLGVSPVTANLVLANQDGPTDEAAAQTWLTQHLATDSGAEAPMR
jgi:transcriptional regulator with XRE-family HTH domain